MCGIAGIYRFNGEPGGEDRQAMEKSLERLAHRGPDGQGMEQSAACLLGHRRLAVLDTTDRAAQPMRTPDGRYLLVYNGEIYNFREIRKRLEKAGYGFRSTGDTEVLLHALAEWWSGCLPELNGCFAFACFDRQENRLLLARDRHGIKPLYYHQSAEKFAFASEAGGLFPFLDTKKPDYASLLQYLHLNYIPGPWTVLEGMRQVPPGSFMEVVPGREPVLRSYLPGPGSGPVPSYAEACERLRGLLEDSVHLRLVSDVPLGAFLSGGTDSSVIVALASRHTERLHTFSIGFSDQPWFDETAYAREVAEAFRTEHTAFYVTAGDVVSRFGRVTERLSGPFADSSALVVNLLSELTRGKVTVALSGDGWDELFAGYYKYAGEFRVRHGGATARAVALLAPLWALLPKGRGSALTNRIRQLDRFARGYRLDNAERYWQWAGFTRGGELFNMLHPRFREEILDRVLPEFWERKKQLTSWLQHPGPEGLRDVLEADRHMVLPGDMLVKTDRMSMAHSLEVRVPMLDHRVTDFVRTLPVDYLINRDGRKRLLRDAFRGLLPEAIYHRPKKGFEVPLRDWLAGPLKDRLQRWSDPDFLNQQGLFAPEAIRQLIRKLHSPDPGESHARLYGFLVFQEWYHRFMK